MAMDPLSEVLSLLRLRDYVSGLFVLPASSGFDFKAHNGGGCFEVNDTYVSGVPKQAYFYCTSDNGKNWSVELTRQAEKRAGLRALTEEQKAERAAAKKYREELVQCPMGGGQVFHKQRQDCPSAGPVVR